MSRTCFESHLGSVWHVCGRGTQDASTRLSAQRTQREDWVTAHQSDAFTVWCQRHVFNMGHSLSVWGHLRAQGLWGLCWRSWVLGTINIHASGSTALLQVGFWHILCCQLCPVSFLEGNTCFAPEGDRVDVQINGPKPGNEAGKCRNRQCKFSSKIDHDEEIHQKGEKSYLNYALVRKAHS